MLAVFPWERQDFIRYKHPPMKLNSILLILLATILAFMLTSCANTNTPTGQAIAAGLQQQAAARSSGLESLGSSRTGMQEFFARGGGQ